MAVFQRDWREMKLKNYKETLKLKRQYTQYTVKYKIYQLVRKPESTVPNNLLVQLLKQYHTRTHPHKRTHLRDNNQNLLIPRGKFRSLQSVFH